TRQQRGRHVVATAQREPGLDGLRVALEVDDAKFSALLSLRSRASQASSNALPVRFLQRRARKHRVASVSGHRAHLGGETVEPRLAILVGERNARGHLGDTCRRMEIVGVEKLPAKPVRQRLADAGFATAANAHDDDDHDFAYFVYFALPLDSAMCSILWPPKL